MSNQKVIDQMAYELLEQQIESLSKRNKEIANWCNEQTGEIRRLSKRNAELEKVVEAARDVSLAQDGIFEMYKGYMTTRESTLSALDEALSQLENECNHEWVSADNEAVKGSVICVKCKEVKALSQLGKEE